MIATLFKPKRPKTPALYNDSFFNTLRQKEYSRLDKDNHVYLDYTGGNLYSESQILKHLNYLKAHTFGNPHSSNPTSKHATYLVEETRNSILDYFNAHDYHCIFTQNASGALKIVGECYPFTATSEYLLFSDNHNSVNGIREYCRNKGGNFNYVPLKFENLRVDEDRLKEALHKNKSASNKLFAYPAQSNVSGVQHDLNWVTYAQQLGWDVLLDAAAYVPTSQLDLSKIKPDFVTMSFYKIFGYPTGLGCLLVKKSKFNKLKKPWFAGGTVTLASVMAPHHFLINNHERFENGTLNYLDIPALKTGLEYINEIGIDHINARVQSLTHYLCEKLSALKHNNEVRKVKLFGPCDRSDTGGTLIMSFFDSRNKVIPFEPIEKQANAKNISLRTGCFCNPGIDEINNNLSAEELDSYFNTRHTGNYNEMINTLQKLRGATRISVGIATNKTDLDYFIDFVKHLE
ncbi:aminotransferase class V-fold PLP-dependent enzyme [Leeuwenhoekiella sp. NPDC079379]|uniref:aminotransferase class V-fold PLP-dependent enzyme n=1 Tax=Leeuwenhoekiella sp. NPDC079379 TaxID=3364122 RepID=UPI0037CABF78